MTLTGLDTLDIRYLEASGGTRPSICSLLTILKNNPGLRPLTLVHSLPGAPLQQQQPSLSPTQDDAVKLDYLTRLSLFDAVDNCANFLSYITFPAHAFIRMVCTAIEPDFYSITSVLQAKFAGDWQALAQGLALFSVPHMLSIFCHSRFQISLQWAFGEAPELGSSITLNIIPILPLQHAHTLTVNDYKSIPGMLWRTLLSEATHLLTLRIVEADARHLPAALVSHSEPAHPSS